MRRKWAFTLIELLVVISIIALLIGILLPALGAARRTARQMQNSTQVRGIQQGCILYAQGNASSGQAGYYPGLTAGGLGDSTITVSANTYGITGPQSNFLAGMCRLLNGNFFTPGYLINPGETNTANIHTSTVITSTVGDTMQTAYTSYAVSQVTYASAAAGGGSVITADADGGRSPEWRDNTNTLALALGDRALASDGTENAAGTADMTTPTSNARSVWTTTAGDWRGSVVFGDNSTQFLTTQVLTSTKYGSQVNGPVDNLLVGTDSTTTTGLGNAKLFRSAS